MDDCNSGAERQSLPGSDVQIPLWTIVTCSGAGHGPGAEGSDSSMDDCNVNARTVIIITEISSDSSMDDCNPTVR